MKTILFSFLFQKRKFDQHINDGKLPTTFEPIGRKKSGNQNVKNLRRSQPSSLSCSSLSEEKMIILEQTQEYCSFCTQDYSHLSDSDDSSTGSNSMKQSNLESQTKDLNDSSSSYPFSTIKEKPSMKLVKVLKPILVNEDFVDGKTSHPLSSKEEDMELIDPPKNFLPSRGNHLPRPIIPIGPRFQAEVPKWEDTTNTKYLDGGDDLKWFGTQVLPMPFISKTNAKSIGKGRPNSCLCDFPRSIYCVQQHIREARELLKLEIGTAFSSWKFDDMGEDVSKSWTFKEQKKFESLVKLYSQSNDTDFWKLAMKHFPSKSMKCMINYYYNVYIPRRMSMETRSSFGLVNHEPKQGLQD